MARTRKGRPIHGWLSVDKPRGMGSTQVVSKVKWLLKPRKIGHAGTLDPMATGILPLALGEATKLVPYGMDASKDYDFTLRFGTTTDSLDADGTVMDDSGSVPGAQAITQSLPRFLGDIDQMPPQFSALKVAGKRAYDLARAGEEVVLKPRRVRIHSLDFLGMDGPDARFSVRCGKGTYVRALARDIAAACGTIGHLVALRRTRVGPFGLDTSISLEKLAETVTDAPADPDVLPLETVLDDIPAYAIGDSAAERIRRGQTIDGADLSPLDPAAQATPAASGATAENRSTRTQDHMILLMHQGLALAMASKAGSVIQPRRVFQI